MVGWTHRQRNPLPGSSGRWRELGHHAVGKIGQLKPQAGRQVRHGLAPKPASPTTNLQHIAFTWPSGLRGQPRKPITAPIFRVDIGSCRQSVRVGVLHSLKIFVVLPSVRSRTHHNHDTFVIDICAPIRSRGSRIARCSEGSRSGL